MRKIFGKFFALLGVFIGVLAAYMYFSYDAPDASGSTIMGDSTLPVINFVINTRDMNYLHGYTMDMDTSYMRDSLTIVGNTGKVEFVINRYSNNIVGIEYEIRSLDGERLIEDDEIADWEVGGDFIRCEINLSSMIKVDEEYMLIIKLATESHSEINYYTRLLKLRESDLELHLDFVEFFSEATLDDEKGQEINQYREYDASVDQTNLGYVDIYCSQDQLTWGNLDVERVTEPILTIKEMYSVFGEYTLQYIVRATNEFDTYQYYNVTEYFRLRQGNTMMYVYSYERTAEQIFEANSQSISTTAITVGIDSDKQIEHLTSRNGSHVSFVKEATLWSMNLSANRMTSVFSFNSTDFADTRSNYKNHDINIISVDNSGNIVFLVYGYMNKGEHEGKNGVSIYRYDAEKNIVNELLFVSSDKPYSILKETAGKLTYVDENNIVYIMLEDSIYTISLESTESVQLVRGLDDGNYIINENNTIIAWHENAEPYAAITIRVMNFENGDDYIIEAGEGEYVRTLGFVDDDLVYGVAKQADVSIDAAGYATFPMYKMIINVSSDRDNFTTYSKENIYITDIEIENNMIKLTRVTKSGEAFVPTSDDRYINSTATSSASAEITTIVTDLKKTELRLVFSYTITSENKLRVNFPDDVVFGGIEGIGVSNSSVEQGKFYVYARGRLYGRYPNASEAITVANAMYGIVVDWNGEFVWGRILRANVANVSGIELRKEAGDSSLTAALRTVLYFNGIDTSALTGEMTAKEAFTLDDSINMVDASAGSILNMVYYIANGQPVIIRLDGSYVLVTGYTGTLTSIDTFTVLDVTSGDVVTYKADELDAKLTGTDTVIISVY